ncbi:MAG TPA: hypothetical protein VIF85_04785 [Gaiellaceae bacterium]|jgi:hypothetical protein|nr:hypothetical protein [Gaiellaceae bacterium]
MGVTGLWDWIRGKGGKPEDEADLREEFGGEDPGEADERYLSEAGYGAGSGIAGGLSIGDAAQAAEDDLADTKPPPDPSP